MINQKESKQVRMVSWLLKLLSRDMKTKTKTMSNKKINIKHNRKIRAIGNVTFTVPEISDHCPRNK